jgi:hypothetical protein
MVQTKNNQAVTVAAMTPVVRVGRVNRVDWGIAAASNEMAGAQRSLTVVAPVIRR